MTGERGVSFTINRVAVVSIERPEAFADALRRLPDSVNKCVCCSRKIGRAPLETPAAILIADESDEMPLGIYSALCEACGSTKPKIEVIETWLTGLYDMYGGLDIPDMHAPGRA